MSKNLPPKIHIPEIGADFLLIPAGAFYVGKSSDEESLRRLAAITRPFYMQETPVTQKQYEIITDRNPSSDNEPANPVEQVSWNKAVDFADRLRRRTGLNFRLPTEMEWEYAARGGDGDKYRFAGSNNIGEVGWYKGNSNNQTHPVKQKKPNGYGLYDMTGNVNEWCADWHGDDYPNRELIDHQGSDPDEYRALRGGSYYGGYYDSARVELRGRFDPDRGLDDLGFRLVLEVPKE